MDRQQDWFAFLLILAGFAGLSVVSRPAPRIPAAGTAAGAPSPAAVPRVVEHPEGAGGLRNALPVLRLIGEHFGVTFGLDPPPPDKKADPGFWESTLASDGQIETALRRRPIVCGPDGDPMRLAEEAAKVAHDVARLARLEPKQGWEELLPRVQANAEVARLLCGAKDRAGKRDVHVRFVIATLPDYVDGNGGWDTDQRIEALQRAAAAAGFQSDRFHLPDWEPDAARKGSEPRRRHEAEPGALLFRAYTWKALIDPRVPDVSRTPANELLVVPIATETATLGIHRGALLAAMTLVTAWSHDEPMDLIGPTFSGSSLSLRAALDVAFPDDFRPCKVRIISGSATALSNQLRLAKPLDAVGKTDCPSVEFHSMTASDDDHLCAIQEYLADTNPSWDSGRGIAVLAESNTSYGSQLVPRDAVEGNAERILRPCSNWFAEAYVFPFPVHISRLRVQAAAVHANDPKPTSDAHVHPRLDEAASTDRVPSLDPELTSAVAEVVLENILDGIDRLGVSAVAIFATDKRDHLFLAQEISRRAPGVLLFALEGNLIYLHPDYRSYTRGTLVVGSYPLFFPTQPAPRKHQFASMAAAGVYNALLAHLSAPNGFTRSASGTAEPDVFEPRLLRRLVDYGDCSSSPEICGPWVWIGMVGRDALWPVRRVSRHEMARRRNGRVKELKEALDRATEEELQIKMGTAPREGGVRAPEDKRASLERALAEAQASAKNNLAYSWPRPHPPQTDRSQPTDVARTPAELRFACPRSATLAALLVLAALAYLCAPWLVHLGLARGPRSPVLRQGLLQARRALDMLYPPDTKPPWPNSRPLPDETLLALRREYDLAMVACVAATFCAAAWLSTAFLAVYARPTSFWWSLLRVLILCAVAGLAALACYKLRPLPRHDRPSLVRRALVAAPVIATLVLFGLSTPSPRLMGEIPTFNGLRFLSLSSLVSPSVPVLCVAAAVMVWGLWRLRQVQLQSAPLRPDSLLPALIWGSHASGGAGVVNELNHPYLHVGARGLALTALPVVVAVALGHRYCYTGEGSAWFGWFLCAGATLVLVLTSFTLAHSLRLGRLLLGGLRALERHPLRLAFGTVHRHGLAWKYSLSPPGTYALAPLVRQAGALAYAIRNGREQVLAEAASVAAPGTIDPAFATDVDTLAQVEMDVCEDLARDASELRSPVAYHASALWSRLEALSGPLVHVLERGPWAKNPYPPDTPAKPPAGKPTDAKSGDAKPSVTPQRLACHDEAETLLALQVACIIRLVLARILSGFTVVVGGLVLLLCAHLFYTFQGRPFWLAMDAGLIALATIVIVGQLARLEKDPVLSRLWGTSPGRLSWAGGLSPRMIVYATVAVLTVFATFFPEVGSAITGWVEPVRKSLP